MLSFFAVTMANAKDYKISSPDNKITLTVSVGSDISWSAVYNGKEVVSASRIAMILEDGRVLGQNEKVRKAKFSTLDEIIRPVVPNKRSEVINNCNILELSFRAGFSVQFRAYNDGVAYRFVTAYKGDITVKNEVSDYVFPNGSHSFFPEETSFMSHNERTFIYSDLDTINRSQAVEKLCPGRDIGALGRDLGITIDGEFSRTKLILGVFNGSGLTKADTNSQKDIAGRIVFYPANSFILGLSHYIGKYSADPKAPFAKRNRTGIDIVTVHGPFSLKGEYIFASDENKNRHGWYVQGAYYLVPKRIQTVIKYDVLYTKGMGTDWVDRATLGINLFFNRN